MSDHAFPTDEDVEAAAIGMFNYDYPSTVNAWPTLPPMMRTTYLNRARAALEAVKARETGESE